MARSLAIKHEDGRVECAAPWFEERLVRRLAGSGPGLYRLSLISDRGAVYIGVGRRCPGATVEEAVRREAARLAALAERPYAPARTGMPGVAGYQEAERASAAAQHEAKKRTRELAAWLAGRKF